MKILVTGASGFLGEHVSRRLVAGGHQVRVLRRPSSNVRHLADLSLDHAIGDVTDPETVMTAVKDQEAVIHAAASTAYWGVKQEIQELVNVQGTKNVVNACRRNGTRLLHVSSIAAIGIAPDPASPANEDFVFNLEETAMMYHLTKWRAEKEVMKEAGNGLDAVVVNPALMWGPEQCGYRGSDALRRPMSSWILPNGPGGRCIVHVSDVVDGILLALERGRIGERYILGGDNVTFREIDETTCGQLGILRLRLSIPGAVAECGNRVKNRLHWLRHKQALPIYDKRFCHQFYDSRKAQKELGFVPRSFRAIVEEWIRNRAAGKVPTDHLRAVRI